MCVIFFYANSKPEPGGYKLILASNRDEFFARETLKANKWENAEYCYGGIDLEPGREGGTWLAISSLNGIIKVGALLNLTGEPKPRNAVVDITNCLHTNETNQHFDFSSNIIKQISSSPELLSNNSNNNILLGRGMLVADYVKSFDLNSSNEVYNENLVHDCANYSAFNFVSIEIGDTTERAKISLVSNMPPRLTRYDEGQCYGFGNSLPQIPFVKVQQGTLRFEEIVKDFVESQDDSSNSEEEHRNIEAHTILNEDRENSQNSLVEKLMNLLKCKEEFWPDAELERRAPNWGKYLSALNVNVPDCGYGSRTHSVILVDCDNKMHFYEETMETLDPMGEWSKTYITKQF